LATVIFVLFFCVLAGSQLLRHGVATESQAIENSLAKSRVYWAMKGHLAYVLSRARSDNDICNGNCTSDDLASDPQNRVIGLSAFLTPIHDIDVALRRRRWDYSDVSGDYFFDISDEVDNHADSLAASNDGHIQFLIRLDTVGDHTLLSGLDTRILDMRADVCFGLSSFTNHCTKVDGSNNSFSGISHVTAIKRIP